VTETEWLECTQLTRVLHFARDIVSDRQLRLFACACCRRVWDSLDGPCRSAVDAAERFADGKAQLHELRFCRELAERTLVERQTRAENLLESARGKYRDYVTVAFRQARAAFAACSSAGDIWYEDASFDYADVHDDASPLRSRYLHPSSLPQLEVFRDCCDLYREIVGNPFRDSECADEWRTDTVLAVARRAYDAREFAALPILADALQDAGCDSADLLNHLRDPHAEHVRGCWALDLVLGKE
jgi:hypothetical protein